MGPSVVALAVLVAAAATSCAPDARSAAPAGPAGVTGTAGAPRVIRLTATDAMRFEPDRVVVRAGETIRFVVSNAGSVIHDLTIGDEADQVRHEAQMRTFFGRQGPLEMRDHGTAVLAEPGGTAELIVTFETPAVVLMGCHVPGHWDARMRGTIIVIAADGGE
ncbi:MAG TPA: plastocyanin/azurin family copper-binding protein [Candidatus Limnocylindrales bacterium]|nr:plastocyanin/azurin family copper-binding protein [Candidatus Limnocylindrales bacterium]